MAFEPWDSRFFVAEFILSEAEELLRMTPLSIGACPGNRCTGEWKWKT
jgi:hypothetical protein